MTTIVFQNFQDNRILGTNIVNPSESLLSSNFGDNQALFKTKGRYYVIKTQQSSNNPQYFKTDLVNIDENSLFIKNGPTVNLINLTTKQLVEYYDNRPTRTKTIMGYKQEVARPYIESGKYIAFTEDSNLFYMVSLFPEKVGMNNPRRQIYTKVKKPV